MFEKSCDKNVIISLKFNALKLCMAEEQRIASQIRKR